MATKSSKNEMLIFGLCSTSDDQPSNWSDKSHTKCEKNGHKLSKNEMLPFGLHPTSDDQPSNKSHPNAKKWLPNENELKKLDLWTR